MSVSPCPRAPAEGRLRSLAFTKASQVLEGLGSWGPMARYTGTWTRGHGTDGFAGLAHQSLTVTWLPGKCLIILLPLQEGHTLGTQKGHTRPITIFKLAYQFPNVCTSG